MTREPAIPKRRCAECGAAKRGEPLTDYAANRLDDASRSRVLVLCGRCVRDRGAAWRMRWRLHGRTFPEVTR